MINSVKFLKFCVLLNLITAVFNFSDFNLTNRTTYSVSSDVYNSSENECKFNNNNNKTICIRKCCKMNYILKNDTCVFSSNYSNSKLTVNISENSNVSEISWNSDIINFVSGSVKCVVPEYYTKLQPGVYPNFTNSFSVENNGKLWVPSTNKSYSYDQYCLEYFEDGLSAFVCVDVDKKDYSRSVTFIGMVISLPFLLATFIVYALLPERNLHGTSLMCYVLTLFVAYLLLIVFKFYRRYMNITLCKTTAMSFFYFFMASLFWINVMSIDIWSTFSGVRKYLSAKKQTKRKHFLLYSLYAWGGPLLLILLIITLSNILPSDAWYNPGFSEKACFITGELPLMLYFYGPIALLIIVNFILCVMTGWKIKQSQKGTAVFKRKGSEKHFYVDNQRFNLYLKLLFAMGINWSTEIITWAINWKVKDIPVVVWYLPDFVNAASGAFIFFIFVFKRSIWKALKRRYYKIRGIPHLSRTATPITFTTNRSSLRNQETQL